MSMSRRFLGYRRPDGAVGCRNHVIILPSDDISNAACEAVANVVQGTMALPHPYGRLQFGPDLDLQGNIIGNPIIPVLKLTANPRTAQQMSEHIDVDISRIITEDMTPDEAADAVTDIVVQTASGRWAAAEVLGHKEFVLTRLHRTA